MPVALVILLLDISLIYHASRTGRMQPWAFIILMVPFLGAMAYICVELIPEWFSSPGARQARQRVASRLDPDKRYRELSDRLADSDTIANRAALADECAKIGRFGEAEQHYDHILKRRWATIRIYAFGKALLRQSCGRRAGDAGRSAEAVAGLRLRRCAPDVRRALAEVGRLDEALEEYHAVADYFPGAEARVRYGMLLQVVGRRARRAWSSTSC